MKASDRLAHVFAVWFGCGYVPLAPGTAGTLGAIPLYLLVRPHGRLAVLATALVLTLLGVWSASSIARRTATRDPQIVVIDEVAGVHFAWLGASHDLPGLAAGVVLFRVFDHVKPWPASWAERALPSGWSIVLDDVLSGLWAAAVLASARALLGPRA